MRKSVLALLPLALFLAMPHAPRSASAAPLAAPPAAEEPRPGERAADPIYRVPIDGLPVQGDARALVTVVAFTDYECPYCKRAEDTVAALTAAYGSDLRVVFAERPLPMHEHARAAAMVALAGDASGHYAAVRKALFAASVLNEAAIARVAQGSSVDVASAVAAGSAASVALGRAEKLADSLNVRGTPMFFINGRLVQGAQPLDTFKAVVDERLADARRLVAAGVRPDQVYDAATANGQARIVDAPEHDSCGSDCKGDAPGEAEDKVAPPPTAGAPSRGPLSAPITIVEYADFQCPYCSRAEASLRAVAAAHPDQVRVVWKDKPLPFHDHAQLYATAAHAAEAQGRFWEMHDRLLALGAPVERAGLIAIAEELGMDAARFGRDLDDPATTSRAAADATEADALGVKGTPTFFVNGVRVVGAQPAAVFEQAIAKAGR